MKVSKKFLKMAEVYKIFCPTDISVDFSEKALESQYLSESKGGIYKFHYNEKNNGVFNGFSLGKHFMDLTIKMWLEDINLQNLVDNNDVSKTLLSIFEIINVSNVKNEYKYPSWFLSKIFPITEEFINNIRYSKLEEEI